MKTTRPADGSGGGDQRGGGPALPSFLTDERLRLLVFGGKGGVGKTTSAAAAALHLARARPAKRIGLVSTDPAHSLRDSTLGEASAANLTVIEFDATAHHRRFLAAHGAQLREIATLGTFLDTEDIDRFLDLSFPGIDELMAFLQISAWARAGEHDVMVVDTAPTGHTLRLLAMPEFLTKWLEVLDALLAKNRYMAGVFGGKGAGAAKVESLDVFLGSLAEQFDAMSALLSDRALARFVPVMLAEPLSVLETTDLLEHLDTLRIAADEIVVNRLVPADPNPALAAWRSRQKTALDTLPGVVSRRRLWGVPLLSEEVHGSRPLAEFYSHLIRPGALQPFFQGAGATPAKEHSGWTAGSLAMPAAPPTRLLFFAGKGGTGKTTMACATAAALAASGKRVLIVSTDPAHSLGDCLDRPLSDAATTVALNLDAIELDAGAQFEELRVEYDDELQDFLENLFESMDLAFDRDVMERLLDLSPPGLDEIMALVRVIDLLDHDGYDALVIDTAPTGHLLRLLQLPELVEKWLSNLFAVFLKYDSVFRLPRFQKRLIALSKGVKRLRSLLADPAACGLYPVAIATEMAFEETKDLVAACEQMKVPVRGLLVNQVTPSGGESGGGTLSDAVRTRERRVLLAFDAQFPRLPRVVVYRHEEPRGPSALAALGAAVYSARGSGTSLAA